MDDEDSSIDIQKVLEIRGYDAVTPIANLPGFVKGVVNLRGILVPIVDMRIKFNFDTLTCDDLTVAIILNHQRPAMGALGERILILVTIDRLMPSFVISG